MADVLGLGSCLRILYKHTLSSHIGIALCCAV